MFVNVEYDRSSGWLFDENTANLIPALREVIEDAELGRLAMCYIALGTDPASAIADTFPDLKERQTEAAKMIFPESKIRDKVVKNKLVVTACKEYFRFSQTRRVKINQSYGDSVEKVADYLQEKVQDINDESIKTVLSVIEKMPAMLKAFDDTVTTKKADTSHTKSRVRGDKQLGYMAQKYSAKNKKR